MVRIRNKTASMLPPLLLLWSVVPAKCAKTALAIKQDFYNNNDSIAIGATNFTDLIQRSDIFVDNSMLIRELIDMGPHPQTILWQGPKNWGKTMNMDMVKMFFEMQFAENGNIIPKQFTDNYRFFANGEIIFDDGTVEKLQSSPLIAHAHDQTGSSYIKYMGRNPVIHVSFQHVNGFDAETRKQQMKSAISRAFKAHAYLASESAQSDRFNNYMGGKDWNNIGYSIRHLCEKLSVHVNRSESVIILIDDFDAPILNLVRSTSDASFAGVNELFTVLQHLFTHIIHHEIGKGCMYRAIFTSKFKLELHSYDKEYFLTDKNDPIDEYFGFNEQNVRQLFEKHGIVDEFEQEALRFYVTGYSLISKKRFYNPSSIAKFLQKKVFEFGPDENIAYIMERMFHVNWFRNAETFLLTLLSDRPTEMKNMKFLPAQYINILSQIHDRFRNRKKGGFDFSHYKEICHSFLLGNGYLTKIPNTNQTKLLNIEMAYSLGDVVNDYCSEKWEKQDLDRIAAMIPILADYLDRNLNTTSSLQKALQEVHSDHHYMENTRDLMRLYAIRILLWFNFQIQVHYEKIPTADIIIINNEMRHAVVFKSFQFQWVNLTHRSSPQLPDHEPVHETFPSLRKITLIGINCNFFQSNLILIEIMQL